MTNFLSSSFDSAFFRPDLFFLASRPSKLNFLAREPRTSFRFRGEEGKALSALFTDRNFVDLCLNDDDEEDASEIETGGGVLVQAVSVEKSTTILLIAFRAINP